MTDDFKTYLFSYRFAEKMWELQIEAANEVEARERLKALAFAKYDGELVATIPAIAPPFIQGPLMSFMCRVRNWFKETPNG